jgi:hypothetical protein
VSESNWMSVLLRAPVSWQTRHCSLSELVKDFIQQGARPAARVDTVVGMFADQPELVNGAVDAAMRVREIGG